MTLALRKLRINELCFSNVLFFSSIWEKADNSAHNTMIPPQNKLCVFIFAPVGQQNAAEYDYDSQQITPCDVFAEKEHRSKLRPKQI